MTLLMSYYYIKRTSMRLEEKIGPLSVRVSIFFFLVTITCCKVYLKTDFFKSRMDTHHTFYWRIG